MSNAKIRNKCAGDAEVWLRAVLRKDTVPLVSVTTRARLEGVDMQELWQAIRNVAIQVDGMGGARYLKLPHTVWHIPKPAPTGDRGLSYAYPSPSDIKVAMARLKLSKDDRIVCPACAHCTGPRCPGGAPTPDLQPIRCNLFQINTNTEG